MVQPYLVCDCNTRITFTRSIVYGIIVKGERGSNEVGYFKKK